jgi:hypothetical protein
MIKALAFCYPSLLIGGAELLFARVILFICKNMDISVRLYDYEDGFIRGFLLENLCEEYEFIPISANSSKIDNLGSEVFVLSSMDLIRFSAALNNWNDVTLFAWDVIYTSWFDRFIPGYLGLKYVLYFIEKRRLVRSLLKNSAVVALEEEGVRLMKKIAGSDYYPIPIVGIPIDRIEYKYNYIKKNIWSIVYIGRSDIWKVTPVRKLIEDLNCCFGSFRITVITDNVDAFKRNLQVVPNRSIVLKIMPSLKGRELDNFLLHNADVGFGMGTSALEFGKLGIPTILADSSFKSFPSGYRYLWLYENEGKSLGHNIEKDPFRGKHQIKDMLESFNSDSMGLSKLTFAYVEKFHRIDVICKEIFVYAQNSTLTPGENFIFVFFQKIKFILKKNFLSFGKSRPLGRDSASW